MKRYVIVAIVLFGLAQPGFGQEDLVTTQEANERILQLGTVFRAQAGDYVIGSGDLLGIDVFDVPDLSREVRVSQSGHISLPLLPVRIRAAGLTVFQLEEKLAELLQVNGLVSHPDVTVFVKEHRSQPIMVVGAVRSPLVYQAIRQTTLLEVLSAAGGLANDAGSVVIVTRPRSSAGSSEESPSEQNEGEDPIDGETITISLKDLLESGNPKYNIALLGGDTVSVPRAGIVYVIGAVVRPGGFALRSDSEEMTILKVLALAGGTTSTAKPRKTVIIRRDPVTEKELEIEVDLKKIMAREAEDVRMLANDILFVPDSTGKKAIFRAAEVAIQLATGIVIFRGR